PQSNGSLSLFLGMRLFTQKADSMRQAWLARAAPSLDRNLRTFSCGFCLSYEPPCYTRFQTISSTPRNNVFLAQGGLLHLWWPYIAQGAWATGGRRGPDRSLWLGVSNAISEPVCRAKRTYLVRRLVLIFLTAPILEDYR